MKCPHCSHKAESILLKCSSCGEVYHQQTLEEFEHVNYLLDWLQGQREVIGDTMAQFLVKTAELKRAEILSVLKPGSFDELAAAKIDKEAREQLALYFALLDRVRGLMSSGKLSVSSTGRLRESINSLMQETWPDVSEDIRLTLPEIQSKDVTAFLLSRLDGWVRNELISAAESSKLRAEYRDRVQDDVKPPVEPEETRQELAPAAEAIQLSDEQLERLAVFRVIRSHVGDWIKACGLSYLIGISLRDAVTDEMKAIHPNAIGYEIMQSLPQISESTARTYLISQIGFWVGNQYLTEAESEIFVDFLKGEEVISDTEVQVQEPASASAAVSQVGMKAEVSVPLEASEPRATIQEPVQKPAPRPVIPPEPRQPLIQWDKVWGNMVEAAVSGLLLRWLRYLGAFLFVMSAAIVVIRFWNDIPQWGQVLIIFFVPTAFYTGGYVLRRRLGVTQTGAVLMGVGQILLAVDFAAIYQFGGLTVDIESYWLITSIICTVFYLLTVIFIVRAEFFGYIGLFGVASTVAASVAITSASMAWPLVAVAAVAVLSVEFGYRLSKRADGWEDIAEAGLRFPQFVIPMVLLLLLLLPLPDIRWAQMAGFAMATCAAGLLSFRLGDVIFTHASVWFSALTAVMLLRGISLEWTWYPTTAGVLSLAYTGIAALIMRETDESQERRSRHLMPFNVGAISMLVIAVAAGFIAAAFDLWPGVISMSFAVVVMGLSAAIYRQPLYVLGAVGLSYVPLSLASWEWLGNTPQKSIWLIGIWVTAAILYNAVSFGLRKYEGYIRWMAAGAQIAAGGSVVVLTGLTMSRMSESWFPTAYTLSGLLVFYIFSAVMHHAGENRFLSDWVESAIEGPVRDSVFVWVAAVLTPFWLATVWRSTILVPEWLAVGIAILALAYVGLGEWLRTSKQAYRVPFRYLPYGISLGVLAFSAGVDLPLMAGLFIVVVVFSLFAALDNKIFDSSAAALVFLWPFSLALDLLGVNPHAYALAYIGLAGIIYIPLAQWFKKKYPEGSYHYPLQGVGYPLSVIAVGWSIRGVFNMFTPELRWVGVIVPLGAAILYSYSAFRVNKWFSWAVVGVLSIAFWQSLLWLQVRPEWHAAAWVGLATVFLLAGVILKRFAKGGQADELLYLPLNTGAWVLAVLSFMLTVPTSLSALLYGTHILESAAFAAPVTAQWLLAALVVLAAVVYRSHWLLFIKPWLTFLPATLMLVGYGSGWFGRTLSSSEFSILWAGWGVLNVALAYIVDQVTSKENRLFGTGAGLYLGGYLQVLLAVTWSPGSGIPFLWAFGLMILVSAGSALAVHHQKHIGWAELREYIFGDQAKSLFEGLFDNLFIWIAAWSLPIWVANFLYELPLVPAFEWLGYVGSALGLLAGAAWLSRFNKDYGWPLYLSGQFFTAFTWLASLPMSLQMISGNFVVGENEMTRLALVLMQVLSVVYYVLFSFVFRREAWGYVFSYAASALIMLPVTLFWQLFGLRLIGRILHPIEFGMVWMVLAALLLGIGAVLETWRERPIYGKALKLGVTVAHAPYLFGYGIAHFGLAWSLSQWSEVNLGKILVVFGGWILLMAASAFLVHVKKHHTWTDLMNTLLADEVSHVAKAIRSAFIWLTAFAVPIWITTWLWWVGVLVSWGYLGYIGTALVFLGAAGWFARIEKTYAWPFVAAAQFYTAFALWLSVQIEPMLQRWQSAGASDPLMKTTMLGLVIVQALSVIFLAISSAYFRNARWVARGFSYAASALVWVPLTYGLILMVFGEMVFPMAYAWFGLSVLLLLIGYGLDAFERQSLEGIRIGFAHGPYLLGYIALIYIVFWSWPDRLVWLYVSGGALLVSLASQYVIHRKKHDTWSDLEGLIALPAGKFGKIGLQTIFLWVSSILFPVWLTSLLAYLDVPLAWRGVGLAVTAPFYIAAGFGLRRLDRNFALPYYVTGYLLTAVGAVLAFDNMLLLIYILALNAVVYAVSAYLFRQPLWLYLTTVLIPIDALLLLQYNLGEMPAAWLTGIFMVLAYLYLAVGQAFDAKAGVGVKYSRFAMPFYIPSLVLSIIGLITALDYRELTIVGYLAGVVLYGLAAWRFKETVFLYPAVWLSAVPYYLGMTYTNLVPAWYGVGWLPLMAAAFVLGYRLFHQQKPIDSPMHPAVPFYSLVYGLSLSMILISWGDMLATAVSLAAMGILYILSAWIFRKAFWLYPGLLTGHLSLIAFAYVDPGRYSLNVLAVLFLPVTAFVTLVGAWLWRNQLELEERGWRQIALDWAAPFLFFGGIDLVIWQIAAGTHLDTGLVVAMGHAVIVAVVAVLWMSTAVVWTSLGFVTLAILFRLLQLEWNLAAVGTLLAGSGFIVYLMGRMLAELAGRFARLRINEAQRRVFELWNSPVTLFGIGLNLVGLVASVGYVFSETSLVAASFIFVGALGLAEAYRRQWYVLGYVSVAALEFAYVLLMLEQEITQLQWYAIPAGLYLVGVAYFERRRGRFDFAALLESLGLIAILLTSFGQSLGLEFGTLYFLLMLVESVMIIAWAAQQRRKLPFMIGASGSVANVIGQVVVVFLGGTTLIRWLIFGGVGLAILLAAIYAERWIIPRAQDMRERLEAWS